MYRYVYRKRKQFTHADVCFHLLTGVKESIGGGASTRVYVKTGDVRCSYVYPLPPLPRSGAGVGLA
jgi:hypothetical protein